MIYLENSMITVHHLNNSRSQRVLWMLEELAQPYEIKRYQRDPKTMLAPDTLRNVHPLGKSPVITDGALTVAESGVIIDYLAHTYGDKSALPAPGSQQWIDYNYWLHYAEGSLMPLLLLGLVFRKIENAPMPFFIKLAETLASMRCGVDPRCRLAIAEASASDMGSVQPSAGTTSCLTALMNSGQSLRWKVNLKNPFLGYCVVANKIR